MQSMGFWSPVLQLGPTGQTIAEALECDAGHTAISPPLVKPAECLSAMSVTNEAMAGCPFMTKVALLMVY